MGEAEEVPVDHAYGAGDTTRRAEAPGEEPHEEDETGGSLTGESDETALPSPGSEEPAPPEQGAPVEAAPEARTVDEELDDLII